MKPNVSKKRNLIELKKSDISSNSGLVYWSSCTENTSKFTFTQIICNYDKLFVYIVDLPINIIWPAGFTVVTISALRRKKK